MVPLEFHILAVNRRANPVTLATSPLALPNVAMVVALELEGTSTLPEVRLMLSLGALDLNVAEPGGCGARSLGSFFSITLCTRSTGGRRVKLLISPVTK